MESHENTHIFKIKKQNSSNIFNIHIFTTFYNLKCASNILLSSKYINHPPPPLIKFYHVRLSTNIAENSWH